MGILQFFPVDKFYVSIDPREFRPGQFCRIVVPHIDPIPRILDVERSEPEEHRYVKFLLRNANQTDDFIKKDRTLPIKNLNLESNEELLARRAKKRPAIIISSDVDIFPHIEKILRQRGKKHCQEDCIFLIPCYHTEAEFDPRGFALEMIPRVRCLIYRQFFYLPEHPKIKESVARFDRIQVVVGRDLSSIKPLDFGLSEDVLGVFKALFIYCLTGVEDKDLKSFRDLARECYSE